LGITFSSWYFAEKDAGVLVYEKYSASSRWGGFLAVVLFEIDTGIGNPLLNLGAYAHKKSI
jgi:hypothetical protein